MLYSPMDSSAPPPKRPRLAPSDDENLDYNSKELGEARWSNTLLLKSRLEGIFAKYSHDFEDQSDVIDLRRGIIVEDNGHLNNMRSELDVGGPNVGSNKAHQLVSERLDSNQKHESTPLDKVGCWSM